MRACVCDFIRVLVFVHRHVYIVCKPVAEDLQTKAREKEKKKKASRLVAGVHESCPQLQPKVTVDYGGMNLGQVQTECG